MAKEKTRNTEDGCVLPEGATKAMPGGKAVQSGLGQVASPVIGLAWVAGAVAEEITGEPSSLKRSADEALGNIKACEEGSMEGKIGAAAANAGMALATGGVTKGAAVVGEHALDEMGINPLTHVRKTIIDRITGR